MIGLKIKQNKTYSTPMQAESEKLGGVSLCGLPDANVALRNALELLKIADKLLNEAMDCINHVDYYYVYYAIKDREDMLRDIIKDVRKIIKKYFDSDVK